MQAAETVLEFWFGKPGTPGYGLFREAWFKRDDALDAEIGQRFGALVEDALAGRLDDWRHAPRTCLALIVLLDQFTRNLFRDTPRAFAGDAQARDLARHAVDRCYDRGLPRAMRNFIYLPFEHSEDMADQDRAVKLFAALADPTGLEWAVKHLEVIARFGRFPHRNAILGRTSTPAEAEFLTQPGYGF